MAPLEDLQNKPLPGRRAAKPAPQAAKAPTPSAAAAAVDTVQPQLEQQQPEVSQHEELGLEEVDEFLRSFRRLDFAAAPEDGAASLASTASSSRLGSPLAAFAAAKERLARSNHEAEGLISSTLQHLGQAAGAPASPAPDASTPRGGHGAPALRPRPALDPSLLAPSPRVRLQRPASAGSGGSPGGELAAGLRPGGNQLLQHQRQHSLLLRERLRSTMQLCQSLHEQNQASMARVTQLWSDNQRLSRSLHEARVDKEVLQQTIRQLTREAAQLAQQARKALLPSAAPAAAAALPPRPASAPSAPVTLAAAAPQPPPQARSAGSLGLVRDWSEAALSASSSGSGGSAHRGAAWQPAALVRAFECGPGATYAQGGEADKRRRLAPGMLAHCLKPVVAEAVAEAAEMAAAAGPGRTPKRKLPQAAPGAAGAPTAAAETQPPGAEPAAAAAAAVPAPAADKSAAAAQEEEAGGRSGPPSPGFLTFELFEARWHGCGAAKAPPAASSKRSACSMM